MSESTTLVDQITAGANAAVRVNENFDAASPSMLYGRRASTTTGLTWGYYGGRFGSTLISNGTVVLTGTSSNYIVAARSNGAVSVSTTNTNWNDTANYVRLYLVVTNSLTATSYEDHRQAIGVASGGGGGLTNITEGSSTTGLNVSPNTVVSLTASQSATNNDFAITPKGSGALLTKTPDGASTGGNKRGSQSVDLQMRRNAAGQVASGAEAVLTGGYNNTASGGQSGVFCGRDNTASGTLGAVLSGFSNSVTAGPAVIAGGGQNSISVTYCGILAGQSNTISTGGDHGFIGAGSGNTVSGDRASVTGGQNNTASGALSFIPGGNGATTRGIRGAGAHGAGTFAAQGDAQVETFVLYRGTTDATPTQLSASNAAAAAANSIVLPNSSLYTFEALVSVRQNTTGDAASFHVRGAIKRGANAAATALVGTPTVTTIGADAGASTWTVAATADTTLGALALTVTGEAAKTLRWVARVVTIEVVG